MSDTHNETDGMQVPAGDVLLHAGDMTRHGTVRDVRHFSKFLASLPHPVKIVIAGNHDLPFDSDNFERLINRKYWGEHASKINPERARA